MVFPGFNKAKRSTISNGDWDRDGVRNRKDCEPLNFKKQDGGKFEWERKCRHCSGKGFTVKEKDGKPETCFVCKGSGVEN